MIKQKKQPQTLTETFDCDPYQGVVAMILSIQKQGYKVVKIDRKGDKATVSYIQKD